MTLSIKAFVLGILFLLSDGLLANNRTIQAPPFLAEHEASQFSTWIDAYQASPDKLNLKAEPQYINQLITSHSPYLLQHADNPINWKPWSKSLLDRAAKHNQLILLSIGYSTCHWCHVMNKQSFSDIEVAKLVNQNFIAIKVDRELSPEIDEYYMTALQQVKGEAGWPITAIINAQGLPIFIDSYLTRPKLIKLLSRVNQLWQSQSEFMLQSAKSIDDLVRSNAAMNRRSDKPIDFEKINQQLIKSLDSEYGGFLGGQKFPTESMLIYALTQLSYRQDEQLEQLVRLQLDKMKTSGIRDHLFGGFHRYSTTQDWMVPHYEKMLYNQAQLILVYLKAYQVLHQLDYLKVAEDTADAMLDAFAIPTKNNKNILGFGTALDADFKGQEGGFYLWLPEQLNKVGVAIDLQHSYQVPSSGQLGLLLKNSPAKKLNSLAFQKDLEKLREFKRSLGELYADPKVLTGWNGLAINGLAQLAIVSKNKRYLELAMAVAERLWNERFKQSIGSLSRNASLAELDQQADERMLYLEDYAFLSSAFISIFDASDNQVWLMRARQLNQAANALFVTEEGAIHNSSREEVLPSLSKISDSEVFPPAAVLLENILKIASRLGTLKANKRHANVISFVNARVSRAQQNQTAQNYLYAANVLSLLADSGDTNGESSSNYSSTLSINSTAYLARGNVKLQFNCLRPMGQFCQSMLIDFDLKKGWHLNANQPLQDHLIATNILVPSGWQVSYPKPIEKVLGFQNEPLSLYEGRFKIHIERKQTDQSKRVLALPIQACSDKICLLPETVKFRM